MLQSLLIFILAAFLELGGGYLVWLWLKEDKSFLLGLGGLIALGLYGIVATWQAQDFGRVYAAYGGIFISGFLCERTISGIINITNRYPHRMERIDRDVN